MEWVKQYSNSCWMEESVDGLLLIHTHTHTQKMQRCRAVLEEIGPAASHGLHLGTPTRE